MKVKIWKLTTIITILVATLLSYGVYYAQGLQTEEHEVITLANYEQNTSVDYTVYLRNNTLYGETIGPGETIYRELVNRIDILFNYDFICNEEGSIEIDYVISSIVEEPRANGWSKAIDELVSIKIDETENAKSSSLVMTCSYNIPEISKIIKKIEDETQYTSSNYQIVTMININVIDNTGVGVIHCPLTDSILLNLDNKIIMIETSDKHLTDSITTNHTETIESVIPLRIGTIIALVAWIVTGSGLTFKLYRADKARVEETPEAEEIMGRLEVVESKDMPNLKMQTLTSIEALKKISNEYSSIIFHCRAEEEDIFFVTENNILYQYILKRKTNESSRTGCNSQVRIPSAW